MHPQKKPEEQTRGEKRDLVRDPPDKRPAGWMMTGFRYKGSPGSRKLCWSILKRIPASKRFLFRESLTVVLFFPGSSTCLLCGQTVESSKDAVMFPAFLGSSHPLHRYSDACLHGGCYAACSDREELEHLYHEFRRIWESRPRDLKSMEEIEAWGRSAFAHFG